MAGGGRLAQAAFARLPSRCHAGDKARSAAVAAAAKAAAKALPAQRERAVAEAAASVRGGVLPGVLR